MPLSNKMQKALVKDIKSFHEHQSDDGHGAGSHGHGAAGHGKSVRKAYYAGKNIEIESHHTISIDGEPLDVHVSVGNDGKAHCHSLPNYGFASLVDLVKELIDYIDEDLPEDELGALADANPDHMHKSKSGKKKAKRKSRKRATKKRSSRKKTKKARKAKKAKKKAKRKTSRRKSTRKGATTRKKSAKRKTKRRTKRRS